MAPRVFLHLGAHKTATSFIQQNLVANRAEMAEAGWKLIYMRRDRVKVYEQIRQMRKGLELSPEGQKTVASFFKGIRKNPQNVLLTSETILGDMSLRDTGVIYHNHAAMIDFLKKQLKGCDVRVGFCIRDFADYIESSYIWLTAQDGRTSTFPKYIGKVDAGHITWTDIIGKIAGTFGAKNMVLWTYEDFKRDPRNAFNKLVGVIGLDANTLTKTFDEPRNVSPRPDTISTSLSWNKLLRRSTHLPAGEVRRLRAEMRTLLSQFTPSETPKRLFTPELRAELGEHYARELVAIRERWGAQLLTLNGDRPAQVEKADAA